MTISLSAKTRNGNPEALRMAERIPAVVYGNNAKNVSLDLDYKDFQKALKGAGESSLITLTVEGEKEARLVLVQEIQKDPVSDKYIHIDFFQPSLKEEVSVAVPLVIEGDAPAVKELNATLVKNISELEIKALPQSLPHEITVNVEGIKTLEDHILAKDIKLPVGVTLNINPDEIVISVSAQTDVDAELAQEIKEDVENVEKVEKPEKEEEVVADESAKSEDKAA